MFEPVFFILLIVMLVAITYQIKVLLCKLIPSFSRFMDKLEAVPENEK